MPYLSFLLTLFFLISPAFSTAEALEQGPSIEQELEGILQKIDKEIEQEYAAPAAIEPIEVDALHPDEQKLSLLETEEAEPETVEVPEDGDAAFLRDMKQNIKPVEEAVQQPLEEIEKEVSEMMESVQETPDSDGEGAAPDEIPEVVAEQPQSEDIDLDETPEEVEEEDQDRLEASQRKVPSPKTLTDDIQWVPKQSVILKGLNTITARVFSARLFVNQKVRFGTLEIYIRAVYEAPPEETPETVCFIEIYDTPPGKQQDLVFSGWMFASNPALSALDHPIYDVWIDAGRD